MNSPGLLIAAGVIALYVLIGPVVLFGIYSLFDSLAQDKDKGSFRKKDNSTHKDPALWSDKDIRDYFGKGHS